MIRSLSPEIIERWPQMSDARMRAFMSQGMDTHQLQRLKAELESIRSSIVTQSEPLLREVLDRVESYLPSTNDIVESLTGREREEALEACDEIRIKFFLLLITSRSSSQSNSHMEHLCQLLNSEGEVPGRSVTHGISGVTYGHIGSDWAIIVPEIKSRAHCDQVLQDLLAVYDQSRGNAHWVFDLSAVKSIPVMFLSALLGYKTSSRPAQVSVCWLRDGLLPPQAMEKIVKMFNCVKAGQYWFSSYDD